MGKRIVIVDDDPYPRQMVAYALRTLGYEVLEAGAGDAGLELVCTELPDLVVTDVQMPGMTGLEMTRALGADPRTAAIPVVMLSANRAPGDREAGLLSGARAYLYKPVLFSQLRDCVAGLLAEQEQARS